MPNEDEKNMNDCAKASDAEVERAVKFLSTITEEQQRTADRVAKAKWEAYDAKVKVYPITTEEAIRIDNIFTYHPPNGNQPARYEILRNGAKELANSILHHCPPSRERSLALTKLEEVCFWANASIARNE